MFKKQRYQSMSSILVYHFFIVIPSGHATFSVMLPFKFSSKFFPVIIYYEGNADIWANKKRCLVYQLSILQLLDCSTIPIILLLSWLFLSTRYLLTHIVGVGICLIGITVFIWADALEGKGASGGILCSENFKLKIRLTKVDISLIKLCTRLCVPCSHFPFPL